jgi:hypothetical protein
LALYPPRVVVTSSGPFESSDPLSVSFAIKNNWLLPLRRVDVSLGLCKFYITPEVDFQGSCDHPETTRLTAPRWADPHHLGIDEQFTVFLVDIFNTPAQSFHGGDISIITSFRSWGIPLLTFHRQFRFVAESQRDGKFYWSPQSNR